MTSTVDYGDRIPNNVDLGRDRVLQRALEHWQPAYMGWWYDMGPSGSHGHDVYLRTAISVDPGGLGSFRLCQDAGVPMGDLPRAPSCRT